MNTLLSEYTHTQRHRSKHTYFTVTFAIGLFNYNTDMTRLTGTVLNESHLIGKRFIRSCVIGNLMSYKL